MSSAHSLKVALIVFGMSVFYMTSLLDIIIAIPKDEYDHARTLRLNEWRVVVEVVILGRIDEALSALRQNAAIGWVMLTMVEGLVKSEGGAGAMLLAQDKYMHLAPVFAIQISIVLLGFCIDFGIGALRRILCPYAYLSLERKNG
jgi:NitT/TauT family transport system permease protein